MQVWNHFDSGSCPGQAIGVRSRLDNGVQGFIPTKFLSDKVVKHPEERVAVRHTRTHARTHAHAGVHRQTHNTLHFLGWFAY